MEFEARSAALDAENRRPRTRFGLRPTSWPVTRQGQETQIHTNIHINHLPEEGTEFNVQKRAYFGPKAQVFPLNFFHFEKLQHMCVELTIALMTCAWEVALFFMLVCIRARVCICVFAQIPFTCGYFVIGSCEN